MRLRKRVVLALGLSLGLPCGALLAQPAGFVVDAGVSQSRPYGTMGLALVDSRTPLTLSLSGLGGAKTNFQPRFRYIADRFRIEATFDETSFYGSLPGSSLPSAGRSLVPANSSLFLTTSYRNFSTSFRYDLLRTSTLSIGPGADLDFIDVRGRAFLSSPSGEVMGNTESNRMLPIPTLSFNVHDGKHRLFADLKVGYSVDGDMAKGRAELGYLFTKHSGVKLGWEGVQYRSGTRQTGSKIRISSLTGGLFFRF